MPKEDVIGQMSCVLCSVVNQNPLLTSTCRTFIFAGTDTTSNALARTLHLLSNHQDVQDKLRAEIVEARNGQDLSYDDLVDLPYLDAVCRETLRL